MRLLLAYRTLDAPAGSESYLVLVAEHLLRLGHDARIWTPAPGRMAQVARDRGIRVFDSLADAGDGLDGLLAQDTETAYALRAQLPEPPLVYVAHSTLFAAQDPPRLDGAADHIVVMNDRVRERIEAGPVPCPVVRLRQPVDRERFRWGAPLTRLRRVLLFGHHTSPHRWAAIERACAALGLELDVAGGRRATVEPAHQVGQADAVIGVGRCVLEAMAAGRPAYVLGNDGPDGWVTPASYPALESDGFAGRATDAALDSARLQADLARWDAAMGESGRDLVARHHDAADHARALVGLFAGTARRAHSPAVPAAELARLSAVATGLENRALAAELRLQRLAADLDGTQERLHAVTTTRRYRLGAALARPLDRLRGPWRSRG